MLLHIAFAFSQSKKVQVWYDNSDTSKKIKSIYHVLNSDPTVLEGTYTEFFESGGKKLEGEYKGGEQVGGWNYFYENGQLKTTLSISDSNFQKLTQFYESGEIKQEGKLLENKKHGKWYYYFEKGGIKQEGTYEMGVKNGVWQQYYESGKLKSNVVYEMGDGHYREYFLNGKIKMEGPIKKNWSEGVWVYYYENGSVKAKGLEVAGVKNGYWQYFYDDGKKMSEGDYIKGKQFGNWKYYHKNGELSSEGSYKDGFKDEYWKLYHLDGGFKGEGNFQKGDGEYVEFYPNGKIKIKGQLKKDKNEGLWNYYYEDGTLEGEADFKDGEGTYIGYYKDGGKKMKGTIKDGQKIGLWEFYDKNGQVTGQLKTLYDQNVIPEFGLVEEELEAKNDSITKAKAQLPDYKPKEKSELVKRLERVYYYKSKYREMDGFIVGANPIAFPIGDFSLYLEKYWQERLGFEIGLHYYHLPFLRSKNKIDVDDVGFKGFAIDVKQKLYHREQEFGMYYYAQSIRYKRITQIGRGDFPSESNFEYIYQDSYELTGEIGVRLVKDVHGPGLTFDVFTGLGIGYRNSTYSYPKEEDFYKEFFKNIPQGKVFVPLRFGFSLGYVF